MAERRSLKGDRPWFGATEAKAHGKAGRRKMDADMVREGEHEQNDS